jgi:hypothetical protein
LTPVSHIGTVVSRMSQYPDPSLSERFSLVLWPGSKAALVELQREAQLREQRHVSRGEVIRQLLKREANRLKRRPQEQTTIVEVRRSREVA